MSETENVAPDTGATSDTFSSDERAYFDSRGEKDIPPEPKADAGEQKEAAPEPKADAPEEKDERKVNYGALAEERGRRKELEAELVKSRELAARMDQRMRDWQQFTTQQRQPQRPPSHDEDIFGAAKYDRQVLTQTRQELEAIKRQGAEAAQRQQIANWASTQEAAFRKDNADYDEAFKHLGESRANELRGVWGLNDYQVQQQLSQEWMQIIQRAGQMGVNPAKLVYDAAKARGYAKKAAPDDEAKKLDVIEHGQNASKSLSNVGGKSGASPEITASFLANMSDREYEEFKTKYPGKHRRLMGSAH